MRHNIGHTEHKHQTERAAKTVSETNGGSNGGIEELRTCRVFCHKNVRCLQFAKAELSIKQLKMAQH